MKDVGGARRIRRRSRRSGRRSCIDRRKMSRSGSFSPTNVVPEAGGSPMRFIARQLPMVALAIVGLASTAPPAAAQDGHRYAMTGLRIRTSPSTDSRILATIPRAAASRSSTAPVIGAGFITAGPRAGLRGVTSRRIRRRALAGTDGTIHTDLPTGSKPTNAEGLLGRTGARNGGCPAGPGYHERRRPPERWRGPTRPPVLPGRSRLRHAPGPPAGRGPEKGRDSRRRASL